MDIGYILLSKQVVETIRRDRSFALAVGSGLWTHLNDEQNNRHPLSSYIGQGVRLRTTHPVSHGREFWIVTEVDKNNEPRTTVVFPEEGGT